ncbi:hypothetical protein H7K45_19325 [Mycobacterium yunnanensis]|uniref:PASTA domain-containing protein n=1 Tax=Mycobacterium yunnanensis TaxID=368477 RepID=A0A9X2Z3B9_9MYCO|nr:hypothetical protein [Mycobacterium yunnanensis]MCV7422703.1 hypothetical protein [Mycobacterium yunnanensis]
MRMNWTIAAAAVGVCGAALAPAVLASAETAQETISRLQSQGYTVTIDKLGTAPISQCQVTSVRNPQSTSQLVPYVGPGNGGERILVQQQTSQTISVSLDCTR